MLSVCSVVADEYSVSKYGFQEMPLVVRETGRRNLVRLAAGVTGWRAWKLGSGDERGRQIGTGLRRRACSVRRMRNKTEKTAQIEGDNSR